MPRCLSGKGGVKVGDGSGTIKQTIGLAEAEQAMYMRFLSKFESGLYDECHKIANLMERLSII